MWRAEAGEGKARSGCGGGSRNDAVADGIQDELQEAVEIAPGQALPANEVSSASMSSWQAVGLRGSISMSYSKQFIKPD